MMVMLIEYVSSDGYIVRHVSNDGYIAMRIK